MPEAGRGLKTVRTYSRPELSARGSKKTLVTHDQRLHESE